MAHTDAHESGKHDAKDSCLPFERPSMLCKVLTSAGSGLPDAQMLDSESETTSTTCTGITGMQVS